MQIEGKKKARAPSRGEKKSKEEGKAGISDEKKRCAAYDRYSKGGGTSINSEHQMGIVQD